MLSQVLQAFCFDTSYVFIRGLTDIYAISTFVHLRFVDLSNNYLSDLNPLATLTQLLWLKVSSPPHSLAKHHLGMLSFTVSVVKKPECISVFVG